MKTREFIKCPVCNDYITSRGKCVYCDWDKDWTAEKTCKTFNNYWKKGSVKPGYEKEPKTPDFFAENIEIKKGE